jgi:hypothetical protein
VPNTWRVANSNDAVTLVPRMLGYCHVGHKAALRGEGQLELTRELGALLRVSVQGVGNGEWEGGGGERACSVDGCVGEGVRCAALCSAAIRIDSCGSQLPAGLVLLGCAAHTWPRCPARPTSAGNSSRGLGEGVEMANVALAAAVNLPALTEQLLARQEEEAAAAGDAGVSDSLLQQSKPALVSAAAAIANAASALAGAAAREEGTSVDDKEGAAAAAASAAAAAAAIAQAPTAAEVASLLEEEVRAMSALLDGR